MTEVAPFTHNQVLEMFDYEPITGNLIWKIRPSNRIRPGDVAGRNSVGDNGRKYIGIDGNRYLLHRIIWLHQKGEWPKGNIAPKNKDYLDTRIDNLVEETAAETASKSGIRSTNKSGVKGVSWNSVKKVWAVHAYKNYQTIFLGQFKELEDAVKCKRDSDVGVFQTNEQVAEANKKSKKVGAQARRLWTNMIKSSNGAHGWSSMEEFYENVGDQPNNYLLEKLDFEEIIGPGNWQWIAPKFDRRTRDGRIEAGKKTYIENYHLKYRAKDLERKFGISDDRYNRILEEQNGVCAICKRPEKSTRNGVIRCLSVDHNHTTNEVRGLLCSNCNTSIGKMMEDKALLQSAIAYLDKWEVIEDTKVEGS